MKKQGEGNRLRNKEWEQMEKEWDSKTGAQGSIPPMVISPPPHPWYDLVSSY